MGNAGSADERESLEGATNLDAKTLQNLHKEFARVSKNGSIDKATFKTVVMQSFANKSEDTNTILTNYVFGLFDKDGSGSIDFREFVMAISYMNGKSKPEDTADLMFRTIDLNGDGQISKSELRDCVKLNQILQKFYRLQSQNPKAKLSDVNLQVDEMAKITNIADGIFRELDDDKSGFVSRSEFVTKVQQNEKVKVIIESLMIKPPPGQTNFFRVSKG